MSNDDADPSQPFEIPTIFFNNSLDTSPNGVTQIPLLNVQRGVKFLEDLDYNQSWWSATIDQDFTLLDYTELQLNFPPKITIPIGSHSFLELVPEYGNHVSDPKKTFFHIYDTNEVLTVSGPNGRDQLCKCCSVECIQIYIENANPDTVIHLGCDITVDYNTDIPSTGDSIFKFHSPT